ncbi:enoyl-CoA hydratase-related protein [Pseudocolwellia sp. AS88]|uniref:enoyl-CoA hydratase-related protein n=1 Tax=Pseudocolwellia sp. AS88 TaxID=3063958 RepID=UPI0026EA175D|nr:enoyl-CoA hydratase-related protein [Pseudocolwellia sp. AS88]MDO7083589.1 enoyl-CoA hydratase-related protein [Pseudocolwellia sp. AS88]
MDNLIVTQKNNHILTITLNRFDKKNALTSSMYRSLAKALNDADTSDDVRCVVIQGDENCFCAGNDLKDFLEHSEELAALEFIDALVSFKKPLIAAVAGHAVGIGTTLLLHCDMVYAANNSKFKLPFTQLGLCPEAGSSRLLPTQIGHTRAFELLVLGKTFSAEQAHSYGLINEVCEPDALLALASGAAKAIAALPLDAVLTSKRLMKSEPTSLTSAIKEEADEFKRLMVSDDCKNILSQFFK